MKKFVALMLALAMVFALAACGSSSAPASSGSAPAPASSGAADYHKVNGPNYYVNMILGYQMPLKLSLFGLQAEFDGFYSDSQFAPQFRSIDGDFCRINLTPLVVFSLSKKDTLFVLFYFERRRGFDTDRGVVNGRDQSDFEMRCSGGEWYFKRLAFRYIHKF